MKTIEDVKYIVKVLTKDEQQLLKDTINKGCWGDCEQEFLRYPAATGSDNLETVYAMGYCTNDAHKAGHFQGRVVSSMFRSIYRKMCSYNRNKIGHILCHCNDWWGDGTGDMLFIREEWYAAFEEWAKGGAE